MGCLHSRGSHSKCDTNAHDKYNFGWRDPEGEFRTIMALDCNYSQECDIGTSRHCARIQRFSNPTTKYNEKKIGNTYNDCSRQHNSVRSIVENYYEPKPISQCRDSTLRFIVNKTERNCKWVAMAKTKERCSKQGGWVATHCPKTCGTCDNCVDAQKKFRSKSGSLKTCKWAKKGQSNSRCQKIGDDMTCRKTCGKC